MHGFSICVTFSWLLFVLQFFSLCGHIIFTETLTILGFQTLSYLGFFISLSLANLSRLCHWTSVMIYYFPSPNVTLEQLYPSICTSKIRWLWPLKKRCSLSSGLCSWIPTSWKSFPTQCFFQPQLNIRLTRKREESYYNIFYK